MEATKPQRRARRSVAARKRGKADSTRIGAMVLAHHRPWLLPLIVQQIRHDWPNGVVQITVDRPNADVVETVSRLENKYDCVEVFEAPFPAVAEREYFMELRNFQLQKVKERDVEFACMWDDDHILEIPKEAERYMRAGYDILYAKKIFFWDKINLYNEQIPEHNSVFFFRVLPDDWFPTDRVIHAPAHVHDSPLSRSVKDRLKLLDIGYLFPEERERVFKNYARAGKLDAATLPLMNPPVLREYRPDKHYPYWYTVLRDRMINVGAKRESTPN